MIARSRWGRGGLLLLLFLLSFGLSGLVMPLSAQPASDPASVPGSLGEGAAPIQLTVLDGHVWKALPGNQLQLLASGATLDWGEGFRSDGDGQAQALVAGGFEVRWKENVAGWFFSPHQWRLERGLLGIQVRSPLAVPLRISTPHSETRLTEGILVVKVVPLLTRVALLKGAATVTRPGGPTQTLQPRQEVGAAFQELSDVYVATDDLLFAWYWKN